MGTIYSTLAAMMQFAARKPRGVSILHVVAAVFKSAFSNLLVSKLLLGIGVLLVNCGQWVYQQFIQNYLVGGVRGLKPCGHVEKLATQRLLTLGSGCGGFCRCSREGYLADSNGGGADDPPSTPAPDH